MTTDGDRLGKTARAAGSRWAALRAGLLLVAALATAAPAHAVLGEKLDSLRQRFGKPAPELQPRKHVATWFIETEASERIMYTVTFGADGRSIAEGLKPVGRAVLKPQLVRDFIEEQREAFRESKTTREVKPGEQYAFAGQAFTCAAHEQVIVDEPADFLIIAIGGDTPSVMAIRAEMLRPAK